MSTAPVEPEKHWRRRARPAATATLMVVLAYVAIAYVAAPGFWLFRDDHAPPPLMRTTTTDDIPGDPLNIGLAGSHQDLIQAFTAAGWRPADAITLKTSIEIGLSVILDRPDPDAPVSTLIYEGRRQDFAFEKPVGSSADERHHVRLWLKQPDQDDQQPLWLGSASFDRGVGVSHDTGQITHHIGPDIDAERDFLMRDLTSAGWIRSTYDIPGSGATDDGRNGGGDRYFTDGKAIVGVLGTAG
ncbi:LssY C-terminal domain-containing protein [Mesorhizobium marinum]|uniref:LssY C-terminal domain-containing protein n=1 Tax=Mesorhizobium marinum TaxID=3228790 RepID=UPI0034678BDD